MLDSHSTACGTRAAQFASLLSRSTGGLPKDSVSVWLPPYHGTKQKARFEVRETPGRPGSSHCFI